MRSFIIQTDIGEMILTLKYYPHNKTFRVFLHGHVNDTTCDGVFFYEETKSKFVKPTQKALFEAAKQIVSYHYIWEPLSQRKFQTFLFELWKEYHSDLFNNRGIQIKDCPEEFFIV